MRYSEVLRTFYKILITQEDADCLDTYFTGAAYHYARMFECEENAVWAAFHFEKHRRHLKALLAVVYFFGDFGDAVDPSGRGLQAKEKWSPLGEVELPDPEMFDSMAADGRFECGKDHPNDRYLKVFDVFEKMAA